MVAIVLGLTNQSSLIPPTFKPLLGVTSAALAAGAVGFGMIGEGARFDTAAPAQAFKEFSATSLSQFQKFEKSMEQSLDLPYLASQLSDAEKAWQAARENVVRKQRGGPGADVEAASLAAKQKADAFEQALAEAAKKVAIEKAALNEMQAWEQVVSKETMKEKAQMQVMKTASAAAAKALSENKFDEAEAATERAKMARAAVMEIQAERNSAILAEESAEAAELYAQQDVMRVMNEIKQMAKTYSVNAAGIKPAEALYFFGDLTSPEKIGAFMSTSEGHQVAMLSVASATALGTLWAAGKRDNISPEEAAAIAASKKVAPPTGTVWAAEKEAAAIAASNKVAAKYTTTTVSKTTVNGSATDGKSSWGSYLDVLGSYSKGPSSVQSSYSPFGKKATGMTSHTSLYGPPAVASTTPAAATSATMPATTTTAAPSATTAVAASTKPAAAAPAASAKPAAATTTTATATTTSSAQQGRSGFGSSGYLDALSGPPGAAVMTSYSPFASKSPAKTAPAEVAPAKAAPAKTVEKKPEIAAHIKLAYKEWCSYYGKQSDDARMQIFADNFALAKEFYKESGRALLLNEYADLTASEYKMLPKRA